MIVHYFIRTILLLIVRIYLCKVIPLTTNGVSGEEMASAGVRPDRIVDGPHPCSEPLLLRDVYLSDVDSRLPVLVDWHHGTVLVLDVFEMGEERVAVAAENEVDAVGSGNEFLVGDEVGIIGPA